MASPLHQLPRQVLEELGRALASGRIQPPYSGLSVGEWLADGDHGAVCAELERLRLAGLTGRQIGLVLDLLATERAMEQRLSDRIQLVWTGPDQEGPAARDTSVVVRELLGQAERSLLIATYSISRSTAFFEPLNAALNRNPDLDVTLIFHVDMSRRSLYGERAVSEFAREFWRSQWQWKSRPKVFFDPRGVREQPSARANQHAKCVVVDGQRVFITSANYTEWAQERNIELGVVVDDRVMAERVIAKFGALIDADFLLPLPG